ncbi:MAG: LytR/AlgR family response regulator transcription factor [Evtepia gabavorous]
MLHVAICDDEETFVQHLNALLTRYAQETGIALKISTYRGGADLVDPYDASLDLIFLDIQMCAMDGLRAAEQIRKLDSKVAIIFLTTLTQYGLEGYQYQATNYIIKAASIHPSQGRDG